MMNWFAENLGTIIITLVLAGVVALICAYLIGQRKKGKSSCGCSCANCAMHGKCHSRQ